ncbi:hypothetical protein DPMN_017291 [Dreissena polymorpha]|uniref:Uncharacterized protein n=1 Tax=Dreissena polymorpha TaxID=45954 RepID=A0A9D4S809_DREPO|nr:hypothetical protein DPMN_017291 [Dreissena polymorpha]
MHVWKDSPGPWKALRGLNIESLSLSGMWIEGMRLNHMESLSESLSSLTQLGTLSIRVKEDVPGLWEALRGLNVKSLSLDITNK